MINVTRLTNLGLFWFSNIVVTKFWPPKSLSSVMCFSLLPDLCLGIIFDHLPLSDLLFRANLVSHQWNRTQKTALKRRHHLTILVGQHPHALIAKSSFANPLVKYQVIDYISDEKVKPLEHFLPGLAFNSLKLVSLDNVVEKLVTSMPNIKVLQIAQWKVHSDIVKHLVFMLYRYYSKLKTLKLWFKYTDGKNQSYRNNMSQLFDAINRLSTLTHLTIDTKYPIILEDHMNTTNMFNLSPITISHLEQLQIHAYKISDWSQLNVHWFQPYLRSNPGLTSLALIQTNQTDDHIESLLALDHQITRRLSHFELWFGSDVSESQLTRLGTRLINLTSISLHLFLAPFTLKFQHLAVWLAPMTQLSWFKLFANLSHHEPITNTDAIPQLHSIKALSLSIATRFHDNFARLQLAHIFPQVQVVKIFNDDYECNCFSNLNKEDRKSSPLVRHCTFQLLSPFRRCVHLEEIHYIDDYMDDYLVPSQL